MKQVIQPTTKHYFLLTLPTVNIWSHLLGSLLFCVFLLYSYLSFTPRYVHASSTDKLALAIFFSGVIICFLLSTMSVPLPFLANQID